MSVRGALGAGALLLILVVTPAPAAEKPALSLVKHSRSSVTLAWRGAEGATGYRLYRDGALFAVTGRDVRQATFSTPAFRSYELAVGAVRPAGEFLSTAAVVPRWAIESIVTTPRAVRMLGPEDSVEAAVASARPGDTLRLRAGSYPRVTIGRAFSADITIQGEPGVSVAGFTMTAGAAGIRIQRLATTAENLVDSARDIVFDGINASAPTGSESGPSCWYLRGGVRDIVIQNSVGRGGWDVIKQYSPPPDLARDIVVRNNNLFGAFQDIIHIDGAVDMTIDHNRIHDPLESENHNDGIQSQHSARLKIVRNTFSFDSVSAVGGPDQAIILGNIPQYWTDRKVVDSYVASNLIHHWNGGTPLILNGTERTTIVNNTIVDSAKAGAATDASIIVTHQGRLGGQNPGLEIWNNIVEMVYIDSHATPPGHFDRNLVSTPFRDVTGTRAIVRNPLFADRVTYRLLPRSPARRTGSTRDRTPVRTLDGSRRPMPPDLGAH